MVDGPAGSKIGPNAFVFEGGRLRLLDEGGPSFTYATAINDNGQVAGVMEERRRITMVRTADVRPGQRPTRTPGSSPMTAAMLALGFMLQAPNESMHADSAPAGALLRQVPRGGPPYRRGRQEWKAAT